MGWERQQEFRTKALAAMAEGDHVEARKFMLWVELDKRDSSIADNAHPIMRWIIGIVMALYFAAGLAAPLFW